MRHDNGDYILRRKLMGDKSDLCHSDTYASLVQSNRKDDGFKSAVIDEFITG